MPGWSKKRKIVIGVCGALVFGGLAAYNLYKSQDKPTDKPVKTVKVKRGRVVEQLKETGRIEFVRTVEVKSTVSGEIVQLLAEPGNVVQQQDVLAVIEPDPNQTLQLYNKRAGVERARIDLDQMRKELRRKDQLHKRKLISEAEVERARDQLEKALNAYGLAQLELETLETRSNIRRNDPSDGSSEQKLDDVRIMAPASGIVIARPVEVGEVVVSGILSSVTGTTMFEIGDPSQMMVKADISEVDLGKLKQGQRVNIIIDAYPDTTYHGVVHRIAPVGVIKQGRSIVTFHTEIRVVDREPRLRQGMSCDIDIIFEERDSTLYLPVGAVYEEFDDDAREGEKKGTRGRFIVYEKAEDEFVEREVRVGLMPDTRIEILDSLDVGSEVAEQAEKIFKKRKKKREKEEKEKQEKKSTEGQNGQKEAPDKQDSQADTASSAGKTDASAE